METDNSGNAPLHWAAKRGDMKVVCALYRTGGCPKQPGKKRINIVLHQFGTHFIIYGDRYITSRLNILRWNQVII